ncbi:MAG: 50S ribosomal protein L10 [Prevotellaceae bacterium]|nr:50S ribosomal protein L10 [Candidatus Faecinaster equi]
MKKEDKNLIIEKLGELMQQYPHFYLVDTTGLNAQQTSDLRRMCFKKDIKMVTVKNTLLEKALEKAEDDFTPLYDSLKGTTSILFSTVANVPAKLIKDKKSGIKAFKAAYAEGGIFGADQLEALASLKSKEEVIADIVALLQSPIKNVVSALQSSGNNIHGVLKTLSERPE